MTSEPLQAYVWVWLPGATEPVVAGRLDETAAVVTFTYGRSYLARPDRVPLFLPELPLVEGILLPLDGMRAPGCIVDVGPDAWGQRVVLRERFGAKSVEDKMTDVGLLDYLLESGSDRIGALDFQTSSTGYEARTTPAPLEELLTAVRRVEAGLPFDPALELALLHGSSLGGARPKVLLDGPSQQKLIAKFARSSDSYPVVKAEGVAMDLARRVGLDVAATEVISCLDADVLLVERFDRTSVPGERRMFVSALTILQLDERWGHYATYHHPRSSGRGVPPRAFRCPPGHRADRPDDPQRMGRCRRPGTAHDGGPRPAVGRPDLEPLDLLHRLTSGSER
jgi:serine/threonine-protein kinase HipA